VRITMGKRSCGNPTKRQLGCMPSVVAVRRIEAEVPLKNKTSGRTVSTETSVLHTVALFEALKGANRRVACLRALDLVHKNLDDLAARLSERETAMQFGWLARRCGRFWGTRCRLVTLTATVLRISSFCSRLEFHLRQNTGVNFLSRTRQCVPQHL